MENPEVHEHCLVFWPDWIVDLCNWREERMQEDPDADFHELTKQWFRERAHLFGLGKKDAEN